MRFGIRSRKLDFEEDEHHRSTAQGRAADRIHGMQQLGRGNPPRPAGSTGASQNERLHDYSIGTNRKKYC